MKAYLWVAIGGAAGSLLRYALQRPLNVDRFPTGTLLVNLLGCLLIGLLWGFTTRGQLGYSGRMLLMSGFCGGFTTLSAFSLEANGLLQQGRSSTFFLYSLVTVLGGLLATFVGYKAIPS